MSSGRRRRYGVGQLGGGQPDPLTTDPRYGIGTIEYMRSVGGYAVTLECGQHDDPTSPEVGYRAIGNAPVFLGLSDAPPPAGNIESLSLYEVVDRAVPADTFSREWSSFNRLTRGELIGSRHDGTPAIALQNEFIVFPDAKALVGNEWSYLAKANG